MYDFKIIEKKCKEGRNSRVNRLIAWTPKRIGVLSICTQSERRIETSSSVPFCLFVAGQILAQSLSRIFSSKLGNIPSRCVLIRRPLWNLETHTHTHTSIRENYLLNMQFEMVPNYLPARETLMCCELEFKT